jgi:hypothetical protein
MSDFHLLLQRLTTAEFEFVLVGAFAAVVHGASVVTRDIDVCCPFTPENLLRLHKAIHDLHPVHRMTPQRLPFELNESNITSFRNVYLQTDSGPLDCLSEIAGVGDYAAVRTRSVNIAVSWGTICVIDLDALIAAKSLLNRLQDKLAIPQLLAIKERQHGNRN